MFFSGSFPECCDHFELLCVCNIHTCEIFQNQNRQRGILSILVYLVPTSESVLLAKAICLSFLRSAVLR